MGDLFKQAKSLLTGEKPQKQWYEELEDEVCALCPSLTYKQRLMGCAFFMLAGFFISMGSFFRLKQLLAGQPESFAIMYTIGNIVSLCSTCCLYGPYAQAKSMFAETRMAVTILYFLLMATTLFLAFYKGDVPGRIPLLITVIICQFLALCWYTISFIPFARDIVKNCISKHCCCCLNENSSGYSIMSTA